MSFLERTKGMPYGGIPDMEIVNKLEETDLKEDIEDISQHYENYIRSEIIDRKLDAPFLESDKTRRDDSLSKSILNLRYNGSRGEYTIPRHPEIFIGFTDHDPRGTDNDPRMDQMQQHITTRMPNLEIRMGHNSDHHEAQSPWTNNSLSKCRVDIQNALNYNTKVFIDELDGKAPNQNILQVYDHNKKGLIYKDLLPETLMNYHTPSTNTNNYTVSSVPFISHDNVFTNSYDNNCNNKLLPNTNTNINKYQNYDGVFYNEQKNRLSKSMASKSNNDLHKHQVNTQAYDESLELNNTKTVQQTQYIPIHLRNQDQSLYNENESILVGNKLMPIQSNINANVKSDQIYNIENINIISKNNDNINTITNPLLLNNDISMLQFDDNIIKKYENNYKTNNDIQFIRYDHSITDSNNNNSYKNAIDMKYNNNNLLLHNSIFPSVKQYNFEDITSYKNNIKLTNNAPIFRDYHQKQNEELYNMTDRKNGYVFNDNISMVTNYTDMESIHTAQSYYSNNENNNKLQNTKKETKIDNVKSDNSWTNAVENNLTNKSQKQQRTSATDDPSIIDIQSTPQVESMRSGINLGNKLIRADYINQEELNIFDI